MVKSLDDRQNQGSSQFSSTPSSSSSRLHSGSPAYIPWNTLSSGTTEYHSTGPSPIGHVGQSVVHGTQGHIPKSVLIIPSYPVLQNWYPDDAVAAIQPRMVRMIKPLQHCPASLYGQVLPWSIPSHINNRNGEILSTSPFQRQQFYSNQGSRHSTDVAYGQAPLGFPHHRNNEDNLGATHGSTMVYAGYPDITASRKSHTSQMSLKELRAVTVERVYGTKPFYMMSEKDIKEKVNNVLINIDAVANGCPVQVGWVEELESGSFMFEAMSISSAKWMRSNRERWVKLADPDLYLHPRRHLCVVHFVPLGCEPESEKFLDDICLENHLPRKEIAKIRLLSRDQHEGQTDCSIKIYSYSPKRADEIASTGLIIYGRYCPGAPFIHSEKQCWNCLRSCHIAKVCIHPPLCAACGGQHSTRSCGHAVRHNYCWRCHQVDMLEGTVGREKSSEDKYKHSALSSYCPQRLFGNNSLIGSILE